MKNILVRVSRVGIVVFVVVFLYALGYNVGYSSADYDYSDSTLTIDELTVRTDHQTITLKGFKSTVDGRCTQELLKLLAVLPAANKQTTRLENKVEELGRQIQEMLYLISGGS